jgi:hypothetical protein
MASRPQMKEEPVLQQVDRAVEEPLGWEDFGRYNNSGLV